MSEHKDLLLYSKVIAAQSVGYEKGTLVLLPGFTGSSSTWAAYTSELSRNYRLILLDTLGFGNSPKPVSLAYSTTDHLEAVKYTLQSLGVEQPFHLIGYSMGSLMALAYAQKFPQAVDKLVLIALPLYSSEEEARHTVKSASLFIRLMGTDNWLAKAACQFMCAFQPLFQKIAPVISPTVPAAVARDGMLHNWSSYSQTLQHLIFEAQGVSWLRQVAKAGHSILLLHGIADKLAPVANVKKLSAGLPNLSLQEFAQAEHNIVFTENTQIIRAILAFL